MVDTTRLHTLTPGEAAALVGVGPHSIRRWCEWHAAHLSPGANPGAGGQRRLTMRDVEVLKEVSNLRLQGLQTEQINEKLAPLTFAEIDTPVTNLAVATVDAPDARDSTPGALVTVDTITAIQRQIDALQQTVSQGKQSQRDYVQGVAVGFIAAGIFFLIIIITAWLYAGR